VTAMPPEDDWFTDDDRLLAELGIAIRAADDVPDSFVAAGQAAFAWHNVDADLAQLTSDSARPDSDRPDSDRPDSADPDSIRSDAELTSAGLRSDGPAQIRTMTFTSAGITIELDVQPDAVRGQVVPAQAGTVEVRPSGGGAGPDYPIEDVGWFVIRPLPAAPFRLSVRLADGGSALTSWITL
jgi:hypothetical protein